MSPEHLIAFLFFFLMMEGLDQVVPAMFQAMIDMNKGIHISWKYFVSILYITICSIHSCRVHLL